jgi:NodT family efflux transporter outer membrane factor (OMF) lipoprotein
MGRAWHCLRTRGNMMLNRSAIAGEKQKGWSMLLTVRKVCRVYPGLHSLTFSAIAASLMLLAACTVGPDYVRPKAEVPAAYKEMEGWKKAQPGDNITQGKWWEIFNDPALNALEEKVDISNQNIAASEAQFRQALAAVRAARSGYFPTATADASFTRSRRPIGAGGTLRTGSTTSDFQLIGGATWEPDLWGKIRRTVEAGEAGAQASAADLEAVRLSIRATLAQDYFQLRTLDAQKQLLDETVIAFEKSLELTKNRYASGVASRADVLQAETQLMTTQAQAIDVGVQRSQTEHAIALLIGKPASTFSSTVAPLTSAPPPIPVGLPSELLERRPDIAAAERLVAAANAQIGVAKAAYYPTLTLMASGGFEGSRLSNWLSWPSRLWSIGSAIAETVFDAGLRRALTDEARAAYDATIASYRQTVLTAFQEVEDNLAALRILEEESQAQNEAVISAQQSLAVTTNQYKAGTVSYLNVIVAQTTELNNERVAVDILGRRMVASALLIKALGGGWSITGLPTAAKSME